MQAPIPDNEVDRLAVLARYDILDTPAEQEYDDIVLLASQICGTPMAVVSLVDRDRQWFKAKVGVEGSETPREESFCAHAILKPNETLVVNDATADERFSDNPNVTGGLGVKFYAGAPLVTRERLALGTLCVFDDKPRELNIQQLAALEALARQLSLRIEMRRTSALLREANEKLENLSLTDELTGLYNRRGFLMHAEQQLKLFRSQRNDKGLWFLVADMDGLKQINDTYGHPEGSAAIKKAGELIKQTLRDADILARPGGDEFTALIVDTLDAVAETVPDRIKSVFEKYNAASDKHYLLSVSIGMAKADMDQSTGIAELIKQADDAMYHVKRRRKGN